MHSDHALVEARLRRFTVDRLTPAIYRDAQPLRAAAWNVPREPVSFDEAMGQTFEPVPLGWRWGRAWSTVWFRVTGALPAAWRAGARDAVDPLKAGLELPDLRAAASFEIGEILQRFKQFPRALQCYRQSAQLAAANEGQIEWRKRALYRAGVLALSMKVLDSSEQYFAALADIDPNYKDVRTHLDKLAEMREDF